MKFTWKYFNQKIPMSFVSGIQEVELDNGFLTPKLGIKIIEFKEIK